VFGFSLRRDFKWFLYVVLNSLAVTPMYVCLALSSTDVTSAFNINYALCPGLTVISFHGLFVPRMKSYSPQVVGTSGLVNALLERI